MNGMTTGDMRKILRLQRWKEQVILSRQLAKSGIIPYCTFLNASVLSALMCLPAWGFYSVS